MQKIERPTVQVNKGRKSVTLESGEWVCVHFRKERFSNYRKSKLDPHGDGPFQILEMANDNAYKIDLPDKCHVNSTFTVSNISPLYVEPVRVQMTHACNFQ